MRVPMTSTKPASPAATRIQQFLLKGYHGVPTSGTVTIRHFNRDERVRRALAGLGKWWGVAVVSVLIPVAHFVLVPSFLGYGVWQCFQSCLPGHSAYVLATPSAASSAWNARAWSTSLSSVPTSMKSAGSGPCAAARRRASWVGSRAVQDAIVRPNAGAIAPQIPRQSAATESIDVW